MLGAVCEELVISIGLDGEALADRKADEMQEEGSHIDDVKEVSWIHIWSANYSWESKLKAARCRCVPLLSAALEK